MNGNSIKYALKQTVPTFIMTAVICFVLFFFLNQTSVNLAAIAADLPLTIGFTAFLCSFLQLFLARGSVKKGTAPDMGSVETQVAYVLAFKSPIAFIIIITLFTFIIFACGPVGALCLFAPEAVIPRFVYISVKALLAALAASFASFHGTVFFTALYQHN